MGLLLLVAFFSWGHSVFFLQRELVESWQGLPSTLPLKAFLELEACVALSAGQGRALQGKERQGEGANGTKRRGTAAHKSTRQAAPYALGNRRLGYLA